MCCLAPHIRRAALGGRLRGQRPLIEGHRHMQQAQLMRSPAQVVASLSLAATLLCILLRNSLLLSFTVRECN